MLQRKCHHANPNLNGSSSFTGGTGKVPANFTYQVDAIRLQIIYEVCAENDVMVQFLILFNRFSCHKEHGFK